MHWIVLLLVSQEEEFIKRFIRWKALSSFWTTGAWMRVELYQYIKVSMYLYCGCCDNYALITFSTTCNSRDVAKEKITRFFLISQASFLLNCTSKIPRCLCFHLQFELVVSPFSAGEISQQPALSDIPATVFHHL